MGLGASAFEKLFEVANVFSPTPDRRLTQKSVAELSHVLGLIDAVMAPPPRAYG